LHIPFKYLILYNNNNLISYTMKKNKKIPNTPKYKFGGFPKLEQGLKDYGLGLADQSLGMLGASNIIKDSQYSDTGFGNFMKKGSAISGEIGKVALPMAANIIAPGSGKFVSMGQQAIGQFNPQDPSQYDEQGNPINPNMQTAKQAIGMAGQIGNMAGGFMGKYGGQMKYAMGGMNIKPNAEVEGGGYGKDGENTLNPDNTATQFNGPTHEQGGIQTNLDPGTLIFSNKIKWDGKTAAEHNKPYAKMIQKANKDLENSNLSKESKLSSHLNLMSATKASQAIFAQMEAKKQAMVQNYAKKMGYGGMMDKMAMGGVQLPFYNTDNAGNPMYAMGGGYPAMTNPYNNFRGSIPMYEDGGNMPVDPPVLGDEPKGAVKVAAVTSNYKPLGTFGNKEYFDKESDKAISGGSGAGSDWENSIIKRLQSGVSIEELVKGGHGTSEGLAKYAPYYKPVYIEKFDNNTTIPSGKYDQRIDRKQVYNTTTNNPYIKYFDYPDANAGYSKATRVAVDAKTGKPVDPIKSFDAKGNYVPSFTIDTGRDYYENTIKSSVPGTNPTNLRLENTGNLRKEAIQTGGFKYGGQMPMPKFWNGGKKDPNETSYYNEEGVSQEEIDRMNNLPSNSSQSSWLTPKMMQESSDLMTEEDYPQLNNVLANNNQNSLLNSTPRLNFSKYGINSGKFNLKQPSNEDLRRQTFGTSSGSETLPGLDPKNKPKWMDIVGKGVNFAAQNAGNIYNLSRYNKPEEEKYERATAKYMDPTKAIAGENYIGRQTKAAIPGLVGGSAGAAMNLLGANKANTATRIGRLRETYDNANAQIGNQVNQYNTGLAQQEVIANAANRARYRSGKGETISQIGKNYNQMALDTKKGKMDQSMMEMMPKLINNPEFQKFYTEWMKNNAGSSVA